MFLYFVSILFSVIVTFLDFLGPKIIQYTVDYCIADTALEKGSVPSFMEILVEKVGGREFLREHLVYVAAAVAAIAVAAAICRYLMKLINSFAAEKFVRDLLDPLLVVKRGSKGVNINHSLRNCIHFCPFSPVPCRQSLPRSP